MSTLTTNFMLQYLWSVSSTNLSGWNMGINPGRHHTLEQVLPQIIRIAQQGDYENISGVYVRWQ
jgi:hypothetical protein